MKPYFAKFLPVEGEIKEGDNYIDTLAKTPGKVWKLYPEGIDHSLSDMKKVQLFLCSRDIKVGDKRVYSGHTGVFEDDLGYEIIAEIKDEFQLKFIKGIAEGGQVIPFKVVGRISPEATWVKEDDEFDEKEVRIRKICHDDSHPPYDSYCTHCGCSSQCLNTEGDEALIKGPCGHHH